MNIGTLIALAAKHAFEESEQRMGARLSPVTLSAEELSAAIQELRDRLGPKVYLVGSAPGVVAAEPTARTYLAPDQRAAERATLWRNQVKVASKERLVYVSVEAHAKASGLRDCLHQLREQDLRAAFKRWASSKGGLPGGLAEALDDADLLGQVRLAALCEFAARIADAGGKTSDAWRVAGEALPVINLARDSRLGKDDTADRLRANHALVRALDTGEGRRRSASGPLAPLEEALHGALANPPKEGRRGALAAVDLGVVKTSNLARGKVAKPKPAVVEPKPAKTEPKADGKKEPPAKPPRLGGEAVPPKGTPPDSPIERALGGEQEPVMPPPASTVEGGPRPAPRSVRLVGDALPKGLAVMLAKLLEGDGDPVELTVKGADRSHLHDLAKTLTPEAREARRARERLRGEFRAWATARRALIDTARGLSGAPSAEEMFTRGISSLLKEPSLAAAFDGFVAAAVELYERAGEVDEVSMREVLTLDTVALRSRGSEVALRVLGPLHLLSLGQTLLARRALDDTRQLPDNARRLIARALEAAPPAPGTLPDESGDLPLARGVGGLLAYERAPELVSADDAAAAARAVVLRYLALCPHALLSMRVAVAGEGDLAPLLEGVASAALSASPRPEVVQVLCARPPSFDGRSLAARALDEGALLLGALDADSARTAHVTLRLAGTHGRPEDDVAAAPAVNTFAPPGGGRTTFDLRAHGLRIRTSVSGSRELEAVEALVARAVGQVPQTAFETNVAGRSLRAECEGSTVDGGWLAIIGQSLGRRPPSPWLLIAHEGFGARATCAVIARDIRAAARSLLDGLAKLGVSDMRPHALRLLAEKLAQAGRSSLVPLVRPAESLVVGGLLGLELRKALGGGDVLIAPLAGAVYETLTGEVEGADSDTLQIGAARAEDGGLRVAIGYATVSASPGIDTSKPTFEGIVARRIGRVLEALQMGNAGARAEAVAAREAIAWALWSAAAADDSDDTWRETLTMWSGAVASTVEALVLIPPGETTAKERVGKVGRAKTTVRPLAIDRLNALLLGTR